MTTATLIAYLPDYNLTQVQREDLTDAAKLLPYLSFCQHDMSSAGYTEVGRVEIEVELLPPDQIVGNAVVALRAKASSIRAKAKAEATMLEGRAQKLLAIENKPTEADHG